MDLLRLTDVLRRYRTLVVIGGVLAVVLAVLSYGHPGWDGGPTMKPTQSETWKSSVTLFLTETGFPEGRAIPSYVPAIEGAPASQVGDQARFADLALVYSQLAASDAVTRLANVKDAKFSAEPLTASTPDFSSTQILPMVKLTATSSSGHLSLAAVNRLSNAFVSYVTTKQNQAHISKEDRVDIQVLAAARKAELVQGPKKTLSALVFVGILTLVGALILVLENLRKARLVEQSGTEVDARRAARPRDAGQESELRSRSRAGSSGTRS
jgi:hypothetical protein